MTDPTLTYDPPAAFTPFREAGGYMQDLDGDGWEDMNFYFAGAVFTVSGQTLAPISTTTYDVSFTTMPLVEDQWFHGGRNYGMTIALTTPPGTRGPWRWRGRRWDSSATTTAASPGSSSCSMRRPGSRGPRARLVALPFVRIDHLRHDDASERSRLAAARRARQVRALRRRQRHPGARHLLAGYVRSCDRLQPVRQRPRPSTRARRSTSRSCRTATPARAKA